MVRNTDGHEAGARSRSDGMQWQRATAAILLMQSEELDINFRSVSLRVRKYRTAWLYRNESSLRDKIMKMRCTSPAAHGESPHRRRLLSHERVVATLRLRIKALEERNRELTEKLEAAYGRFLVVAYSPSWAH